MEYPRHRAITYGVIAAVAAVVTSTITLFVPSARAQGNTAPARRAVSSPTTAPAAPAPASPAGAAAAGVAPVPGPAGDPALATAKKVLQSVTALVGTLIPPSRPHTTQVGALIEPQVTLDVTHPVAPGRATLKAAMITASLHASGTEYFITNDPPGQIRTQTLGSEIDMELDIQRQPKRFYFVTCGFAAPESGNAPAAIVRTAGQTLLPWQVVPRNGFIEFVVPMTQAADVIDVNVTINIAPNQTSATFNLTGCQLTSFDPAR